MHCPNCGDVEFLSRERFGARIDYCPLCGGVWLARQELQRLSETTGLFLKNRAGAPAIPPGLKRPLWQEIFDVPNP